MQEQLRWRFFAVSVLVLASRVLGSASGSATPWAVMKQQPLARRPFLHPISVSKSDAFPVHKFERIGYASKEEPNFDNGGLVRAVGTVTQVLISCGKTVLPPVFAVVKGIVKFYRSLPRDAVVAQVGLVYCFGGGYYPTLFSALQAAQQCGWNVMVHAIEELTEEAIKVIDVTAELSSEPVSSRELFLKQTNIVLKTVDPVKINQAAGALFTTWLGVSAVLEREYARTISLSLTLSSYLELLASHILEPPLRLCISKDYHRWIPVLVGWGCKAAAMNVAWRIQRVLTASTSAMAGGLMFSRAILRMLARRGIRLFGLVDSEKSPLDEVLGFMVAGLGFYTQFEAQYRNNFSFDVPFPLSLITWPFDLAEKWIQWQITKR